MIVRILAYGNGPVGEVRTEPYYHYQSVTVPDFIQQIGPPLWKELHTEVRTLERFEAWVKKVPNWDCGCQTWLLNYIQSHPYPGMQQSPSKEEFVCIGTPRVQPEVLLELRIRYGWELHNAVNEKLRNEGKNRPHFSWEEYLKLYPFEFELT